MRVGLVPQLVGYIGVIAGALFIIGFPSGLTPVIQGYWLAATGGHAGRPLAQRRPAGLGVGRRGAVAADAAAPDQRGTRRAGKRRRRVSDQECSPRSSKREPPPNPRAAAGEAQAPIAALTVALTSGGRRWVGPQSMRRPSQPWSLAFVVGACSAWIFCSRAAITVGVAQGGDVAERAAFGDVAQQPAHDLARAGLGQVVGPDDPLRAGELADPLGDRRRGSPPRSRRCPRSCPAG